jgi:hypothetical protein
MISEKIKFLKDREVEAQGEVIASFKAGQVYEMPVPSARRWIRRGVAEVYAADAPAKPKKTTKPKKTRKAKSAKTLDAAEEKQMTDYALPAGRIDRPGVLKSEDGDDPAA